MRRIGCPSFLAEEPDNVQVTFRARIVEGGPTIRVLRMDVRLMAFHSQ